jgi:pimeloyl-ACP methyl ester carboxylesterase
LLYRIIVTDRNWSLGTVIADITAHLAPGTLSSIVYTAAVPWVSAFEGVADPFLVGQILPGLVTFDNATAALESRIKIIESLVEDPKKIPTETKWAWVGGAALVGPLTTQLLLARQQDHEPLLQAGAAGIPTLLITGGKDNFIQPEPLKDLLEQNFTNIVTYHFPQGGHAMFYEFPDEYAREVGNFAASVFKNVASSKN